MARIDRLEPREKRTLQMASVLGPVFPTEVLAHMMRTLMDSAQLTESLAELRRREFVDARRCDAGDGTVWNQHAFRQTMTLDVAYGSLLLAERRRLHRAAAEALETVLPDRTEELSAIVGHHFERAGAHEKALDYLLRAGRRAADLFAYDEAIDCFRGALVEAESFEAPAESIAAVRDGLGDACFLRSDYPAAQDHYERALSCMTDGAGRARMHRKLGLVCEKWGRWEAAADQFAAALREAGDALEDAEAARIYTGLGLVHYRLNDLEKAISLGRQALDLMNRLEDERGVAQACNNLGIALGGRGNWEESIASHRRALTIWEKLADPYGQAASHNNLGLALQMGGNFDEALAHCRRSAELFEDVGNQHGLARANDNMCRIYAGQGRDEEATECLQKAVEILTEIGGEKEMQPEMWQSGEW